MRLDRHDPHCDPPPSACPRHDVPLGRPQVRAVVLLFFLSVYPSAADARRLPVCGGCIFFLSVYPSAADTRRLPFVADVFFLGRLPFCGGCPTSTDVEHGYPERKADTKTHCVTLRSQAEHLTEVAGCAYDRVDVRGGSIAPGVCGGNCTAPEGS